MGPIRVLVVDDSVVVRRLLVATFEGDDEIRVVGTAPDGRIALDKLEQLAPDVVVLDVEMPVLDGLETLRRLRRLRPALPVIVFSTLTERGGAKTLEALALGADDYVTKPSLPRSAGDAVAEVREQLAPRIKALCARRRPTPVQPPEIAPVTGSLPRERVDVLAVGSSTGGPDTLAHLVADLPPDLPVPVLVAQHMPPLFTRLFAERLDRLTSLSVREAVDGQVLRAGDVLVAPGDWHLRVGRAGEARVARLDQGPKESYCRPAVDALFRSVAEEYGAHSLAVVLTGMGSDGRAGCESVVAAGGEVVVQDRDTSVVWGMPGAVAAAGLAHHVLPLDGIVGHVLGSLRRAR